jgi:HAD superfamily hydrolase (TIGR01509 family)
MIQTILMDLDGTLCDCTELHYISLNKALYQISSFEISQADHETTFNGLTTKNKLEMLVLNNKIDAADKQKIWEFKQKLTKELISETLKYDTDKVNMLQYLKDKNIKLACITNSITETSTLILKATGQFEFMDLLISNNMVKFPKPHPEGYIRAMIHFQSMPENSLIVEDSDVGMAAANASGANVWRIKNTYELTLDNMIKTMEQYA